MNILYEDNHLLIINKPCGEIVQSDPSGDEPLEERAKKYIKERYHKEGDAFLGVVHRVDRPVSGIVIFARTTKAQVRLNRMFYDRDVEKTYLAIVKELPPQKAGTLINYILRDTKANRSRIRPDERDGAKRAVLHYRHIDSSERYHLLEIGLETGRHHQIRCQLAAAGCPIRGDLKYGYARSNPGGGISLHAWRVRFTHPVKGVEMDVTAPFPEDTLWKSFEAAVMS